MSRKNALGAVRENRSVVDTNNSHGNNTTTDLKVLLPRIGSIDDFLKILLAELDRIESEREKIFARIHEIETRR